jgi:hypothetical protein
VDFVEETQIEDGYSCAPNDEIVPHQSIKQRNKAATINGGYPWPIQIVQDRQLRDFIPN